MSGTKRTNSSSAGEEIRVSGARVHNLKDVTLSVPTGKITVFTGVSGSGKSSVVFDTIGVEAQRQLYSTFPWFIRNQLPRYERPAVDAVERLGTPVLVDQKPLGGSARSTVGTITDILPVLRTLFARHADPEHGRPSQYSFNNPQGMCPDCDGLGKSVRLDLDRMLDTSKSLNDGAVLFPEYKVGGPDFQIWANSGMYDPDKPLKRFTKKEMEDFLHGTGGKVTVKTKNTSFATNYEGLEDRFTRLYLKRDISTLSERKRETVKQFVTDGECASCGGTRLNAAALATKIQRKNIAEWAALQVDELIELLGKLTGATVKAIADNARVGLERMAAIGLGYLTLDRQTSTLSGGEAQRLKLVRHLGSDLTGMLYIFDEPSTGLHPHDVGRLTALLKALSDRGNTVLVVEHDPDVIAIADHVVDLGPGAGVHGGEVVFEGTVAALRKSSTATGKALSAPTKLNTTPRTPTGKLPVKKAALHNLKNVSVEFPAGVLTAVTGVAGSGKSTLVEQVFLAEYPDAIFVDQKPISASLRSTPATFIGVMDGIRKLFAKAGKVSEGLFSFNSKGACEECEGRGVIITELAYMDPVTSECESCGGRRFTDAVLEHELRGKSIADVLEMPISEAAEFFTEPALAPKLKALVEVGLGYLSLGQSLSTLSGGERQRLKLANELHREGSVFVLDEPTTGLHLSDVDTLMGILGTLVEKNNTVIVIEHNLDVIRQADWIIDLGPEGGTAGGEIVFTGKPADLVKHGTSLTGQHLKRHCG
ncbi:excinuclease ABC, A subunit [Amycolatopsis lurida]|uniref:ATP-binding cassette domain-containing protein n=1 Tax=Amycolatopsis lurida TaxID=31959 RepID=UPI00089500CE|nr:excinuclease ABC subunit UvrA [Amycolatopsis lurida]SEE45666.1 excinuclease ABC, A subunit [Amycolatopsis lurida]